MFRIIRRTVDLEIRPMGRRGPTFRASNIEEHEAREIVGMVEDAAMSACYSDKRLGLEPPAHQLAAEGNLTGTGKKLKVAR